MKIPLGRQITETRNIVLGLRAQASQRRKYAPELATRAEDQASVMEAVMQTLQFVETNKDVIRAAVAARSTVDAE